MTSSKAVDETKSSSRVGVTPLSTDAFTQPLSHVSSSNSIGNTSATPSSITTTTTTSTSTTTSNSDGTFNINVQSPGGTPSAFPSSNANNNNGTKKNKVVAFKDSSEEDFDEDDDGEYDQDDDNDIDIVLAHKKDINRLNVLKNKIAQSPVYFTRYLVETYPHMIQHNQQQQLLDDDENNLLLEPNVRRNIWKNQQYGFINEMCGTVYNEFKAKQLFLSRSYKSSPSTSSSSNNNNNNNINNGNNGGDGNNNNSPSVATTTNYCKQYYFYTPYENYILPDLDAQQQQQQQYQRKEKVSGKDKILPPNNDSPTPTITTVENNNNSNTTPVAVPTTREKNSSVIVDMDHPQSSSSSSLAALDIAVTTNNNNNTPQNSNDSDSNNSNSTNNTTTTTTTTSISAGEGVTTIKEVNLEIPQHHQQPTNCTENNQKVEYQHRRVVSDSATLWSGSSINNSTITLESDKSSPQQEQEEFKTPPKKITLTNGFDSADDLSSVPSTADRGTDILGSNREGDIRFMIDPSASPFIPLSPLVASERTFSPRSVPVSAIGGAFQEGLSPSRLIRSGSAVALDKKMPNNLQSPLKKKAHRRVKSFNLTHAAGALGSEFDIKCVKIELIMLDIDIYMTKFEPIRIMSDRWVRDLDFFKFGVKIFNRIYIWLEDSLVHQFSTDKIDLSGCPTIEFNLSEQPLSKVLDTTCQIINEYNTKQKYSYYNYHSFSFARRVIEKLSGKKLKSKNALPKTLFKYYREYRDTEKKRQEKEEKEEKEQAKSGSSATSPSTTSNEVNADEFGDDTTPVCKENLPLTPADYLDLLIEEERNRDVNFIYYVPKRLILKKYRKFHQKQEIKNHTYLLNLINSLLEQCPNFKEEYKFDYFILKTIDRKFWLEKYQQEKYDPVKHKCKFYHKEGTKIHFEEPTYLKDLLKEKIHRRRKMFNVKIEDDRLSMDESPYWKIVDDNTITNFSKYREEKKGKTVKVLSLDGGGMKGLVLIEILKVIEERVGKKICEIFDIVAGTSTGGIVALLINGGVPMKIAKEFYIDIGRNIFDLKTTRNKSLVKTMKVLRGRSWYDGYHLEMTSIRMNQDVDLNTLHKRAPFTFLVSTMDKSTNPKMNLEEPTAFVFRTYSDPYDYVEQEGAGGESSSSSSSTTLSKKQPSFYRGTTTGYGITAMDAIRATSAAPMYFKPRVIGDSEFIDGAVVANNPIQLSMHEAKQIFPNHDRFVFVSLGTGALSGKNNDENGDEEVNFNGSPQGNNTKPRKKSFMRAFKGISQTLNTLLSVVNLQLSSDRIHKMATAQLEFFKEGKSLCEYFRLNVPGLGDKGLDEVNDELFALFEKETVAYMENHPDLDKICKLLSQE